MIFKPSYTHQYDSFVNIKKYSICEIKFYNICLKYSLSLPTRILYTFYPTVFCPRHMTCFDQCNMSGSDVYCFLELLKAIEGSNILLFSLKLKCQCPGRGWFFEPRSQSEEKMEYSCSQPAENS